ncbi:phage tail length tape measure family protein [Agrobacterium rosae]|uniref:Phage tail length tape measure family protein n=1 Tax=Agrobacterium rosae TaxID=1972867 RepID=A0AAW9FD22_9HYPH|nr:phage tail length tape measure family protein [Agrobacterium rosae]MDX8301492.1 phage tail length tape measure family protein [Agrobacterium rosae]
MVMKISARVEIDATPAQRGSADASKAVQTIGTAADRTTAQLEKLQKTAAEGLRGSMSVVGGTTSTNAQDAAAAALERLKAKYDPVIAAQLKYKTRVAEIAQAQAAGAVSASQAIDLRMREKASLDAMVGSLNNVAAARKASAENAVARATITPDRGADVAAYGAELDKLRMRYNPLFAVITNYKQSQADIRQAHAVGAISADEMSAALDRQRRSTLASIDAIKGRNKAISDTPVANNGVRGFETANIAAQFQDIGVTAAMGMSPIQIALQQGTQLSAIIGGMQNPIRGLAAAFMSVISPISLVTIGVIAAGAAAIQYFTSAGDKAKSADTILKQHAETITSLKERYGEAASGLREFVTEGITGTAVDLRDRIKDAQDLIKEAATARSTYSVMIAPFASSTDSKTLSDWRQAFIDLRKSIADGKPDILSFRNSMALIAENTSLPAGLRKLAKEMRDFKEEGVVDTARAIPGMVQQLNLIGGSASGQINDVKALSNALRDLAGIAMPSLSDADKISAAANAGLRAAVQSNGTINEEARRRVLLQQQAAQQRLAEQTIINSDGNQTNVPIPGNKPVTLGDRDRAAERSATSTANAYRDLIKTADDRVAQMKLEAQLAGQTGVASDALRFKLDLLQQSEDKGRSLTSSQVEAINKRVEAFKKYAEEAAKATLKADLLFEREQMGRSAMDQQIASGLRGAGLEIDFDSYEAGLIRTNLQLQYARELAGDFANTFFSSFEQGKSVLESLGDAGVSALKRIANTMLNDVLNSIFSVNSAMSGSGGGGGFFKSLFSGIGSLFGGGGKFPSAPGGLYDQGGYTGPGGIHEARGVVHAGEIVWSQRNIADAGGVATVEAMRLGRRGYDNGGVVGVTPLMAASRSVNMLSQQAQTLQLMLKLGVSVDETGTIMPLIRQVVAEDAPGIAVQVVEDFSTNGLPDRIAAYNQDPRAR